LAARGVVVFSLASGLGSALMEWLLDLGLGSALMEWLLDLGSSLGLTE
jgi:hypothetical protein